MKTLWSAQTCLRFKNGDASPLAVAKATAASRSLAVIATRRDFKAVTRHRTPK
jgi:hypothetical protein